MVKGEERFNIQQGHTVGRGKVSKSTHLEGTENSFRFK
jgi:hypothetical protein